jgi:hypothetical protein
MATPRSGAVLAVSAGLLSLLGPNPADAASPASIAGTWSATGNQATGSLVIAQASSTATCKPISGTIFGSTIEGFYCPATGRVVFARRLSSGIPFQLYQGQVARDAAVDRIGGTFVVWNAAGGGAANEGVDFNFSATKP